MTKADPVQIQQILMNLAANARAAMPNGGTLMVQTRNIELSAEELRGRGGMKPGPYVTLEVSDTGSGMSPQTLEHVFEPFFTTKTAGPGIGLGLATVYGVVKQNGGTIWVFSEVGRGTTFEICLPRVDGVIQPKSIPHTSDLRGTETVLLVDDDDTVRQVARTALEAHGYVVLEAPDGFAAISCARHHSGRIHLLVSDLVMSGMSGTTLFAHIETMCAGIKTLYLSEYASNAEELQESAVARGTRVLDKPFTPTGLLSKIREVLDAAK